MRDQELGWIERYLDSLARERRLSPHTISAYRADLGSLAAWLAGNAIADWGGVVSQDIRRFAAECHRDGLGARSIQRRLSAVRGFYGYLAREAVVRGNPADDIRAPKGPKRLPKTLDVDQMARLLGERQGPAVSDADEVLLCRDHAALELLYSSGLRLAEILGLDLADLDIRDHTARVLGKGSKTRIVPVGRMALDALQRWLKVRPTLAAVDEQAIYIGRNGRRLGARALQLRVAAYARRQGISSHVHPHLFRHSFASHLLESSGDLRGVQELLGHANISTTQVYTHLDFQHLARTYDASHPRARRRSKP